MYMTNILESFKHVDFPQATLDSQKIFDDMFDPFLRWKANHLDPKSADIQQKGITGSTFDVGGCHSSYVGSDQWIPYCIKKRVSDGKLDEPLQIVTLLATSL